MAEILITDNNQIDNPQTILIAETLINGGDLHSQIQAAGVIRRIIRSSSTDSSIKLRSRFAVADVIPPFFDLLSSVDVMAHEALLLALLNLAVPDDRKVEIATSGAIPPLVELLKHRITDCRN